MGEKLTVAILAAGKGKRMSSALPKVLHPILGRPMLFYVIEAVRYLSPRRLFVVVGTGEEEVRKEFADFPLSFVTQKEQLGTAHALSILSSYLEDEEGELMVVNGDTPLLRGETLSAMLSFHRKEKNKATVLTTVLEDPTGYGRIIRNDGGGFSHIVEERDATPEERRIKEVNAGVYIFSLPHPFTVIPEIKRDNEQGEYYLPDALPLLKKRGEKIGLFPAPDPKEILGVNNRIELSAATRILRERILTELALSGATIIDPLSTFIEPGVIVEPDAIIHPFVVIRGRSRIGRGSEIHPFTYLVDTVTAEEVTIYPNTVIMGAEIGRAAKIGPFSRIRPETKIGERVKIGNFVEVKNSEIREGSKASHLSYLGDSTVGPGVNVGAGTITCNYDGVSKHPTIIGPEAFIGSNTALVAPIKIGAGSYIGAGSTITHDVPENALAIGRAKQVIIKDWALKRRKKKD